MSNHGDPEIARLREEIEILARAIRDTIQCDVTQERLHGEAIANWTLQKFAGEMRRRNEQLIPLLRKYQNSVVEPLIEPGDEPIWQPGME